MVIFNWSNYYKLAEYLLENESDNIDAVYRSIVSRAYYAAYGKTRLYCINNRIITNAEATSSTCHAVIVRKLKEADDLELLYISNDIATLKLRRQAADYEAHTEIKKPYVIEALKKSKDILDSLQKLSD